ncbi:helix-turn-helix domain-containing protein [Hymenobacter aerophilus]|uniref:helix-turn-helix domain-containing protein n=1 Tax=Hymenobacter aerophilus TaxID=119644 RepID=UPI000361E37F|nr:helix-turn-helix domain-containing protein [Hymenobacter aerophilus]
MPQKAIPSTTLAAAVRGHLALSQEQLAAYLGISRGQVAHEEAGRRPLRGEAARLLRELAAQLPPALGSADELPANALHSAALAPAAALIIRRQLAKCRWQLANLRVQISGDEARVALAHRWQALADTDGPATTPADGVSSPEAAAIRRQRLLRGWATVAADALAPAAVAKRALLALRSQLLMAEIRTLEELLAGAAAA